MGRRTREHIAVCDGEEATVAAAFEGVLIRAVKDRAGIVCADAAVGDVVGFVRANEDAGRDVGGVLEDFVSANGNFAELSDDDGGSGTRVVPPAKGNEAGGENGGEGNGDGFRETAARGEWGSHAQGYRT